MLLFTYGSRNKNPQKRIEETKEGEGKVNLFLLTCSAWKYVKRKMPQA
jgi:hypothetical protein